MRKVRGGYFETVGIMRHLIFQPKVGVGGGGGNCEIL